MTADEVYSLLKPNNPNLSLGTVYRNLNMLFENGHINKLHMPNGSDRFDGELSDHFHIFCSKCGKIFDIDNCLLSDFKDKINDDIGVQLITNQLIINGICKDCQI